MNKNEHESSWYFVALVMAIPIGTVIADLIGRLRMLLIEEWCYISWGLLILISAAGIIRIYWHFLKVHESVEFDLKQEIQKLNTKLEELERSNDHRFSEQKRITELHRSQLDRQSTELRQLSKNVKELTERKVLEETPQIVTETVIDQAVAEIAEGGL